MDAPFFKMGWIGWGFELAIMHPYLVMKTGAEKAVVIQVIEQLLSSRGLIIVLKESLFLFRC